MSKEKIEEQASKKRLLSGEVISSKMDKTIVVKVVRKFKHPQFGKVLKREKNYKVHDESEVAATGDVVEFQECRPFSKTKHMSLIRVVKKADVDSSVSIG